MQPELTEQRRDLLAVLRRWLPLLGGFTACVISFFSGLDFSDHIGAFHRQGKAALLLIKILPNNPWIENAVNPDPVKCAELAAELNEMGYIHPPLITSNNAMDLLDRNPPVTPHHTFGKLEHAGRRGTNGVVVTGWAIFPQYYLPADAVVLSYQDLNDRPIIFWMADIGMQRPDISVAYDDTRYQSCGWVANFPISVLPANIKPLKLNAWAIDSSTGRAYRLENEISIQLNS